METAEYEMLRQEIYHWQSRRFTLLAISAAFVTAVLGFSIGANDHLRSHIGSMIALVFLAVACHLSAYCGKSSEIIGAYLQVKYEEKSASFSWETDYQKFKLEYKGRIFNLNSTLVACYLGLAFIAIVVPTLVRGFGPLPAIYVFPYLVLSLILVNVLIQLHCSQKDRENILKIWRNA